MTRSTLAHSAHRFPARLGAILGAVCSVLVFALGAQASDHNYTEEFHQTYTLTPNGRIELSNINGPVHISTWDQNQVKVDAVKYAGTKERLAEAKIQIQAHENSISIETKYPNHDQTFNWGWSNNPASVEYTLTVPRGARLDEVQLVNGELDITGATGEVHASCINGKLVAHNLSGRAELSTVNGHLEASFDQLAGPSIDLSSVNGSVNLTIPSDSKAEIEASTVSGGINNDFGLHVDHQNFVGHTLNGELGNGGTHIKLENVNGRIEIKHASDGRALSPAKNSGDDEKDSEI